MLTKDVAHTVVVTHWVNNSEQGVMSALFLVACSLSVDVITASLCTDIGSMITPTGVGLHAFKKVPMTGLYPCAAECTSTSKCTSFNYCLKTRMCELIRETTFSSAEGGPTEGCMYVDQWPDVSNRFYHFTSLVFDIHAL